MPVSPSRRALLTAGLLAPVLSSCSALGVFNAVAPADDGARLAAEGVSYGPDPRHKLDVFTPEPRPGGANARLPVVLFIYGGSWNNGSRGDYAFVGRALASRGIVTAVIDYRLVPQVRYPGFVEDAALATRWVRGEIARFGGDPRRIIVMGHSAGAYNAAMVALNPAFTREVGLQGSVYRGFVGLAGPYDFYPFDVGASREAFGQWPRPQETQPVAIARRGAPPTFLGYGTEDTTVLPRNSRKLAEVLRGLGVRVVERAYPGVSHAGILLALSKPLRERGPVLDDVVAFIKGV